ncbi:hypothetical protein DL771_007688 [Monosporascus sp. 5C6A]|nr:hypothetical protein DL771_007688 [Monosporascus sp. 5C6A]
MNPYLDPYPCSYFLRYRPIGLPPPLTRLRHRRPRVLSVRRKTPYSNAYPNEGSGLAYLECWVLLARLVQERIEVLERLADEGTANWLSHSMAHLLLANNLSTRGREVGDMQSMAMQGLEAFANVAIKADKGGF